MKWSIWITKILRRDGFLTALTAHALAATVATSVGALLVLIWLLRVLPVIVILLFVIWIVLVRTSTALTSGWVTTATFSHSLVRTFAWNGLVLVDSGPFVFGILLVKRVIRRLLVWRLLIVWLVQLLLFQTDFLLLTIVGLIEIISIDWIFPGRLTISWILWLHTRTFTFMCLTRSNKFWREVSGESFVFLASAFLMEAIVAGQTQELLTICAPSGTFLFFALLTNSYASMRHTHTWLITFLINGTCRLVMLDVIALRAQKNLTVGASAIYFAIFAELTSKIHS